MRVGVTGGRHYRDVAAVALALAALPKDAVLVHGAATGADAAAALAWSSCGGTTEAHPADWGRDGKAAGVIRNQRMVDSGLDMLIAFPGGRGTADMIRRAEKAGIPVTRISE